MVLRTYQLSVGWCRVSACDSERARQIILREPPASSHSHESYRFINPASSQVHHAIDWRSWLLARKVVRMYRLGMMNCDWFLEDLAKHCRWLMGCILWRLGSAIMELIRRYNRGCILLDGKEFFGFQSGICTAFREHKTVTGKLLTPVSDRPMVSGPILTERPRRTQCHSFHYTVELMNKELESLQPLPGQHLKYSHTATSALHATKYIDSLSSWIGSWSSISNGDKSSVLLW